MGNSMFVSTAAMLKNRQPKFTYAETEEWLCKVRKESSVVFNKLGECLQKKSSHIPYDLLRSDTKYNDGSWSPLFRVLRPERIENVVNLIRSFKFKTGTDEERATHLRDLISPIIQQWMELFDHIDAYYEDPQASMLLKTQFKSLATYNKLFVLNTNRISTGEIFDRDSYRDVFNGFVRYYNEFVRRCISASSLDDGGDIAPNKEPPPCKRGTPKLSGEQLERRKNAARLLIQEVRKKYENVPDQITVKDIDAVALELYNNGGKNVVPKGEEADFSPFTSDRERNRWARKNVKMSFRQLCISSNWKKKLS